MLKQLRMVPSPPDPAISARGGPIVVPVALDRYHATRLEQLARISLDEREAKVLWDAMLAHRAKLSAQLGRDVGLRVALLDHITNVRPRALDAQIIARDALELLEHHSSTDRLTGLFNRAYFDLQLTRECERLRRYDSPAALLLLDIDRFKQVNDTEGHRRGDEVLQRVSGIVRDCLRAADIPCRYGGDEIAAILTSADATESSLVAERVRDGVAAAYRLSAVPVTVSIGLTMLVPIVGPRMEEEAFLRADRALYVAKRAGGDRVQILWD
jgi:diguanylate cyclase (GGDEF)-like protein